MTNKLQLFLIVFLFSITTASAQSGVEMADVMRSNGKIYVVVAVAAIVLFGLLAYLIRIDRKVASLEKEVQNRKNGN